MRSAFSTAFLAFAAQALAGGEERVKVSDLTIHKIGSPFGPTIESVSFKLNGEDAKDLKCAAENVAFPKPSDNLPCGKSDYSFTLWEGQEGEEFRIMVYHDVGDPKADLRGGADIPTICDNSQGSDPADEICQQKKPVSFKIDGPVGDHPGL
ncbi:major allergen alt [Fusarium austroafricanum]|uniref:Major allergen alt n=1 Tax=Fusarium austroafricanum TaxID=2364996 RepID=A0A8H4KLB4_9HYPO|nr:major allergen alt [Fusarium austroafricanum]